MNNTLYIDNFTIWRESDTTPLPDTSFIPAMLRRRLTALEKIALSLAHHIAPTDRPYTTVFASRYGEWEQTARLISQFHTDHEMSPAGFSNSVHNAAPGHLSLLTKNKNSYTSIAAGARTLEMGLLTAFLQPKPTLFIYAEERTPDLYDSVFPHKIKSHGLALFINDTATATPILVSNATTTQTTPLSFDRVCDFLSQGTTITANHWTITKQ